MSPSSEDFDSEKHLKAFKEMFGKRLVDPKIFPATYQHMVNMYIHDFTVKNAPEPVVEVIDLT